MAEEKLPLLQSLFERRDSIKVSKATNGKFSFEVKRYYDFDRNDADEIIRQIKRIYDRLERQFDG